jgi:Mrp family chromosome partitioning ATPase
MSAIDRAFIKAYSDEPLAASESPAPAARRSIPAETKTANMPAATTKSTTTSAAPRKSAGRARRSVVAAAIRADEPTANVIAAPIHPQRDQAISTSTHAASATVQNKPKMVVGRKALQKLAESAVVPSPHMSFQPAGQAVGNANSDGTSDEAMGDEIVAGSVLRERKLQQPPFKEAHSTQAEAAAAPRPKTSQFRLDPAVPATTSRKPSSSAAARLTAPTSLAAQGPESVETPELRPLSSYRKQETPTAPVAALEVDRLAWPSACRMLIERAGSELESAAAMIAEQSLTESQTLAIASTDDGEGCTTIALCMAIKLAERGARVCLVDGNVSRPQVAELVGLEPERGLESILAGEATLGEVLIESLEDRLTLLPLCKPIGAEMIERSKLRQTVTFGELRDQFDIVLVDAGCVGSPKARCSILDGGSIDAAILVGCASDERIAWQRARRALEHRSIPCWGAIENRCQ